VILVEELAEAGVPAMGANDTFGLTMPSSTLLRQVFCPRTVLTRRSA